MNSNINDEIEIDLGELLHVIYRKIWIIVLVGMIAAVSMGVCTTLFVEAKYTSTAKLYIVNKETSTSSLSLSDLQMGNQLTQDYIILIQSRPVLQQVIDTLKLDMTYQELSEMISLNNPDNTRILTIEVEYSDPYMTKQIVDEIVDVSLKRIHDITELDAPNIIEEGDVPEHSSSPNLVKNVVIASIVGIVISMVIICIIHLMNDTIRNQEDVEKYLGLSTIGLIPYADDKASTKTPKKQRKGKAEKVAKKGELESESHNF